MADLKDLTFEQLVALNTKRLLEDLCNGQYKGLHSVSFNITELSTRWRYDKLTKDSELVKAIREAQHAITTAGTRKLVLKKHLVGLLQALGHVTNSQFI